MTPPISAESVFNLQAGAFRAAIGEIGPSKSGPMKIVSGIHPRDVGEVAPGHDHLDLNMDFAARDIPPLRPWPESAFSPFSAENPGAATQRENGSPAAAGPANMLPRARLKAPCMEQRSSSACSGRNYT